MTNKTENSVPSTSAILRVIQNHYTAKAPIKSEKQLDRERWLIPGIVPFNRWLCMPAAFVVQFCCGSLYSWSVFNKPIDKLVYGDNLAVPANMAPFTFYIAVSLLGISAAIMGPWLERNGPTVASVLGGTLFCAGNLLTALALHFRQMWLVYVGYGIVAGYGIGLCYISPVSALQKWFPDRRGLASGIAVAGFGAGAIASAKLEIFLIDKTNLPMTFIIMGVGYFFCIITSGLVLRTPPPNFSPVAADSEIPKNPENGVEMQDVQGSGAQDNIPKWTLLEALASRDFRLIYVVFFSNILFGLVAISRLSNMTTDIFGQSVETASTVVAINGGFNLSGRLFFPLLSDYIGRRNAYVFLLTTQLIILTAFYFITTTKSYWVFLGAIWLIAACYGGGYGCIPAFLTDKFGPSNVGATHGVILTAWSLAGIVGGVVYSTIFKFAQDGRDSADPTPYNVNVYWILGVVAVGYACLMGVKGTQRDDKVCGALGLRCCVKSEESNSNCNK